MFLSGPGGSMICKSFFKNCVVNCLDSVHCRTLAELSFKNNLDINLKNEIEQKWGDSVNKGRFQENRPNKFYVLSMFPYPSGNLHMGHVRVYTISDVLARFHRMNGRNVLHPMGFDAFGLPAENAAFQHKIDPKEWTLSNIASMKAQLMSLGLSFDWEREVVTCSEDYYKFTQYIFLLLYKAGLVYQKEALVNWDPVDKTVLADEQVDSFGKSWRSGATVEKKLLKQWFIRTSRFAHSLTEGLDDPKLKDWRDIISLQKHWLGECDGARFDFQIIVDGVPIETVSIWVKYAEHIGEAAFIGASPNSLLGLKYFQSEYVLKALNPFNNKILPVIITDELEFDEGCDMKLGFPAYDESDRIVSRKYGIEFEEKELINNYDKRLQICLLALDAGVGGYFVSSKLRDWLISRQRHWGTPIPIAHCKDCGVVPIDIKDLPLRLTDSIETSCPHCNGPAVRETDTMDTFVDSSWYFLRYTDSQNLSEPFSGPIANQLMPVDIYIGGKEHAVLHLYYSRFLCHFLHSIKLLEVQEPFQRLLVQGMVMGRTYYVQETGKCISKDDIIKKGNEFFEKDSGLKVVETWEKMSKSKFNGVEPDSIIKEYGIDTTRLLILSEVAPTSHRHWDSDKFAGILNWQKRLWTLMADFLEARKSVGTVNDNYTQKNDDLWDARNYYIKGTTFNYSVSHQLSIVISKLQGLTNALKKCDTYVMANSLSFERCIAELVIMLYPLAPHFSSELWEGLQMAPNRIDKQEEYIQWDRPISEQKWPKLDDDYNLELICKVNNAVKATIKLPYAIFTKMTGDNALQIALSHNKVSSFLYGCDILDYDYSIIDSYEATINIKIDHWQKRQIAKAVKN